MVSKRQLGFGFMVLGVASALSTFAIDWYRSSNDTGYSTEIGPVQIVMLVGAALVFLVGLSLLPLGNKPA